MPITRFCHYTTFCKDLDVSMAFYRDVLGMDVQPRELPPGYPSGAIVYFADGAWCVHLFQATAEQTREFDSIAGSKAGVLKHVALRADGYVWMTGQLRSRSIAFREFTIGDRHVVQFLDPEGLEIELAFDPAELPDGPIPFSGS